MAILPAVSSAMHGAVVPIAYAYASSTTNSFSFSNIPQKYQDLFLVINARSDFSGNQSGVSIYLNGASSTAGYSVTSLYGDGASAISIRGTTSTPTYGFTFGDTAIPAASATTGIFGTIETNILNYANTSTYKTALMRSASDLNGSGRTWLTSALWANTSAITSFTVNTQGNWVTGSSATLYGIRTIGQ